MALTSFASTVLTRYKADTTDAKQKIRQLSGEQKKAAKEHLKSLEDQNAGIQRHIDKIGKIAFAVGAITGAVVVAKKAWDMYVDDSTLRLNLHEHNIEALKVAAGGLRTEHELMQLAVADNNGAWNLNQKQLETVTMAMRSLEKQGNDSNRVFENVKKAVTEGSIEPLKEFGIVIEGVTGKEAQMSAFMQAMQDETHKFGGDLTNVNDDAKKSMVALKDSFQELGVTIGQTVSALAPVLSVLADSIAAIIGTLAGAPEWFATNVLGMDTRVTMKGKASLAQIELQTVKDSIARADRNMDQWNARGSVSKIHAEGNAFLASIGSKDAVTADSVNAWASSLLGFSISNNAKALAKALKAQSGRKRGGRGGGAKANRGFLGVEDDGLMFDLMDTTIDVDIGSGLGLGGIGGTAFLDQQAAASAERGSRGSRYAAFQDRQSAANENYLSGVFGPIEKFDAYASAFDMLSGAATSAFSAWIDGSMGVGAAMKQFAAQSMKALATDMFGKSLQHAAYAIGSLAFGDVRGAASHGKAAAAFGAGAVATGLLAKELGGGGSGGQRPVAGAGGGGGAGVRVGGGADQSFSSTVVIGDDFADDSPRQRARKMARALDLAKRSKNDEVVRFS